MSFTEVLDIGELPPGKSTTVTVGGRNVALFNVDGEIYATDDACAHAGSSLGWGILEGKIVKCRAHGLRFEVTSGKVVGNPEVGVSSYPAKVRDGKIFVSIGEVPQVGST